MQAGDKFRVIEGKHEGKVGEIISGYQIEGLEGGDFDSLWWVEFEDGSADIIQEALMEPE